MLVGFVAIIAWKEFPGRCVIDLSSATTAFKIIAEKTILNRVSRVHFIIPAKSGDILYIFM